MVVKAQTKEDVQFTILVLRFEDWHGLKRKLTLGD